MSWRFAGRVIGAEEKPLAGADVWIEMLVDGALERVAAVQSDESGAFDLDVSLLRGMSDAEFDEAEVSLGAWSPGHALSRDLLYPEQFAGSEGRDSRDILLFSGGLVRGRVVDQGGRPVPGATVASDLGNTTTDARGEYQLGSSWEELVIFEASRSTWVRLPSWTIR